jgi:hypothetical protein
MISKRVASLRVFVLPLALAATGMACSSNNPGAAEAPDGGAAPTEMATVGPGDLPCNINSHYPGDDKCILAPDPKLGFQFHYGPSNYTDPAEVAKYLLMPGDEVTDCVFFPTPNKTDVYFNEYHSRMRPGSHHMLLYIQPISGTAPITSTAPTACNQGAQTRNLFGAQTAVMDVTALAGAAPEDDGLAVKIPATQQAVMQLHFINAGTTPILREGWANILYTDPAKVKILGDPIFFIAGVRMSIPMGTTQTLTGSATVPQNADPKFRLVIGTGHYHTHTTRFTAWSIIGGQKQVIIDEFNPLGHLPEPGNWFYTSTRTNPTPNATSMVSGGHTGTLYMKPGDQIQWQCEVTNNNVSSNSPAPYNAPSITFANAVYTGEMCNMFGLYAPTNGGPWQGLNF